MEGVIEASSEPIIFHAICPTGAENAHRCGATLNLQLLIVVFHIGGSETAFWQILCERFCLATQLHNSINSSIAISLRPKQADKGEIIRRLCKYYLNRKSTSQG